MTITATDREALLSKWIKPSSDDEQTLWGSITGSGVDGLPGWDHP